MILHLSTFQSEGGAAIAASRLNHALRTQGVDSHLLTYQAKHPGGNVTAWANDPWKRKAFWARFAAERLSFLPYERDKTVRFSFSPAAVGVPIERHPLVKRADLINLHWINFGFLSLSGLERLFSLGKPIVWTQHDMWALTGGCHYSRGCDHFQSHCRLCPYLARPAAYDLSFELFEQKKKILAQAPVTFVSPSRWLTGITQSAALTQTLPALTIPNPIDTSLFAPLPKAQARQLLGLPSDQPLILFAGANTQDPRKGYTYFKEAINSLSFPDDKAGVVFFGKSRPGAYGQIRLPVHDLGPLTSFDHIVAAYAAADVLVVSSLEDNLPNTVMEAMACGTPVVGFRQGGIPEMIDHQVNGYVADFKSSTSLAEGMQWVLENSASKELPASARQKVLDTYAEAVVARQYKDLYQSLL